MKDNARIADLSLAIRRQHEIQWQRDLDDGLTRRHVQIATERSAYQAVMYSRLLNLGPEARETLQRLGGR